MIAINSNVKDIILLVFKYNFAIFHMIPEMRWDILRGYIKLALKCKFNGLSKFQLKIQTDTHL